MDRLQITATYKLASNLIQKQSEKASPSSSSGRKDKK